MLMNEPSPRDADRKIEEQVAANAAEVRQQIQQEEDAKKKTEELGNLGFVRKEEMIQLFEEWKKGTDISKLEAKMEEILELVGRAKARGQFSGASDDSVKPEEPRLKNWERNTLQNLERRAGKKL